MSSQRAFETEDGYLLLEQPDGTFTDGDLTFETPLLTPATDPEYPEDTARGGKAYELADGLGGVPIGGNLYADIDASRPDLAHRVQGIRQSLNEV